MAEMPVEEKAGIPGWLVSFGDMMTLILTFFILLVSMAQERQYGMIAEGLGSFVSALRSHGLPGVLSTSERMDIFNNFRRRFNLPVEEDPERRESFQNASDVELLSAQLAQALTPHDELFQPQVASFTDDSAELSRPARDYIDRLADTLRPRSGQILLLEGHAADAGERHVDDDRYLAGERARAVRQSRARSCPKAVIVPAVGRTSPHTAPISVVLPAPFGPSSAKISPLRISRSIPSSALVPPA